jgi:hypothetical protein
MPLLCTNCARTNGQTYVPIRYHFETAHFDAEAASLRHIAILRSNGTTMVL